MAQHVPHNAPRSRKARLWLAAVDGARRSRPLDDVAPVGKPERPLEIEFVGLTEAEQRAALAAFPGGRRFVLKSHKH
jgi:hypothetical protein